jgi:hypothetical protein
LAEGERRIKEPCFCIELFVFLKRMGLEIEPILCVFILKDGTKIEPIFVCVFIKEILKERSTHRAIFPFQE